MNTIGTITKMRGMTAVSATSTAADEIALSANHISAGTKIRGGTEDERIMTNDKQIQHDVLAALGQERNVVADSIGVEVHHGVVKLAGHVSDQAAMECAERAARRVDDVTTVIMDIDVVGAGTAPQVAVI